MIEAKASAASSHPATRAALMETTSGPGRGTRSPRLGHVYPSPSAAVAGRRVRAWRLGQETRSRRGESRIGDLAALPTRDRTIPLLHRGLRRPDNSRPRERGSATPKIGPTLALYLQVEMVEEAVERRRHQHAHAGEQGDAAVERVRRREQLAAHGPDRVDRPHPAENHRRVQQRVDPREPAQIPVAGAPRPAASRAPWPRRWWRWPAAAARSRAPGAAARGGARSGSGSRDVSGSRRQHELAEVLARLDPPVGPRARRRAASPSPPPGAARRRRTNSSTSTSSDRRPIHDPITA